MASTLVTSNTFDKRSVTMRLILRHLHVEAAEPGLHMGDGDAHLRCYQGRCGGGVHIAVNDDEIWLMLDEEIL